MEYVTKVWCGTAATKVEIKQETPPTCEGSPGSDSRCKTRPDHVVAYTRNRTGLPGLGRHVYAFACHRHLHPILKHAEEMAVAIVTVTAYEGV